MRHERMFSPPAQALPNDGPGSPLFGGERAGTGGPSFDPLGQLTLRAEVLGSDPHPTPHATTSHDGQLCPRRTDELVRLCQANSHEYSTLSTGCNSHIAPDEKRHAAEHLLAPESRLILEKFEYPIGQLLVVRHRSSVQSQARAGTDDRSGTHRHLQRLARAHNSGDGQRDLFRFPHGHWARQWEHRNYGVR
jgi:hypothetical protein